MDTGYDMKNINIEDITLSKYILDHLILLGTIQLKTSKIQEQELTGVLDHIVVDHNIRQIVAATQSIELMRNPAKWIKLKETSNVLGYEEVNKNCKKLKEETKVKNKKNGR